jgi:hypothetical protein
MVRFYAVFIKVRQAGKKKISFSCKKYPTFVSAWVFRWPLVPPDKREPGENPGQYPLL